MHIVSLGYAPNPSAEERAGAAAFYNSLKTMIPCPICRSHYAEFLAEEPVATKSRDDLIDWVYRLHNKVNARLGKPVLPFDAFVRNMRALAASGPFKLPTGEHTASTSQILVGTAAILGISAAAYYYFKHK